MTLKEYQEAARRTQNNKLTQEEKLRHALLGLVAECYELFDDCISDTEQIIATAETAAKSADEKLKESGDITWMIAELCDVRGWDMETQMGYAPMPNKIITDQDEAAFLIMEVAAQIAGAFQKELQGHEIDEERMTRYLRFIEIGLTTINRRDEEEDSKDVMGRILDANIAKLKKRYPDGFSEEKSVNRTE